MSQEGGGGGGGGRQSNFSIIQFFVELANLKFPKQKIDRNFRLFFKAPLASDLEKFCGGLKPVVVASSPLLSWIAGFNVCDMKGIGPAIADKLEEMGVTRLAQLQLQSLVRKKSLKNSKFFG